MITLDRLEKKIDAIGENTLDLQKRCEALTHKLETLNGKLDGGFDGLAKELGRIGNNLGALALIEARKKGYTIAPRKKRSKP